MNKYSLIKNIHPNHGIFYKIQNFMKVENVMLITFGKTSLLVNAKDKNKLTLKFHEGEIEKK